jgi:hypothetical protein
MARREKSVRDRAREADRYREAVESALDQLEWCVNYLYRIRKPTLAAQLDSNRKRILSEVQRIGGRAPRR